LNDKELQDLQLFGNKIEKPLIKQEGKKKISHDFSYEKKPIKKHILKKYFSIIRKKLPIISYQILKKLIILSKWILKKIIIIETKIQIWIINKKYKSLKNKKEIKKTYQLIETRKKRRNKIIIVRKRVLIPYDIQKLTSKKPDIGTIYYMALKEDEDDKQKTKPEAYTKLKDSVWDFPV